MKAKHALLGLFVVCNFTMSQSGQAATFNWDSNNTAAPVAFDGGGVWTNANNFHNGTANITWPTGTAVTDIAAFGNTASTPIGLPGSVTFTTAISAGGLNFNPYYGTAARYTITGGAGGTLQLNGTPAITMTTHPVRPFARIDAILAGTAGSNIASSTGGILEIGSQANTITGGFRLQTGATLSVSADPGLGGTGNGLTFSGTSTLLARAAGANFNVAPTRPISIANGSTGRFDIQLLTTAGNPQMSVTLLGGIGQTGGTGSLQKEGAGNLVLNAASSYTGSTIVRQGTLTLNFANGSAPVSNLVNSASQLRLAGGTLSVAGLTSAANTQTFAGTVLGSGSSGLTSSIGVNGTTSVDLGAITREAGSNLNVSTIAAGTGYTTSNANVNGILGGYATVAAADWATVSVGSLAAFAGYQTGTDATAWVAADNVTLAASPTVPLAGNSTINSLRLTDASSITVPGGNTLTLASGGLLSTGTGASAITGGTLRGSAASDLSVIQNSSGDLAISSVIADNGGATALTKSGSGSLTLTGANTFSGNVFLNGGSLSADSIAALGTGTTVTSRAGTSLTLAGSSAITSSKNFVFDLGSDSYGPVGLAGSATDSGNFNLNVTNTGGVTLSGQINVTGGTLVKKGAGALTLTNTGINQLARLNGGQAFHVQGGSVTFDGGAASEWRVGQGEFVIGTGDVATAASSQEAVVNVQSGLIHIGSWTGLARGNGSANLSSKIIMTGGTWDTGNFSMGFNNGVAQAVKPVLDLSGNSSMIVRDLVNFSENSGSEATINMSGSSQFRVRNNIAVSLNGNAKTTVNMTDTSVMSAATMTIGGGATSISAFNLSGSANLSTTGSVRTGNAAGAQGSFTLTGNSSMSVGSFLTIGSPGIGTISVGDTSTFAVATDFNVADTDGSRGVYNFSGGTTTGVVVYIGKGSNAAGDLNTNGVVNHTGGTFNSTGGTEWRWGGNAVNDNEVYGSYAISGGALNVGGRNFQVGAFGRGVLDISGTGAVTQTGGTPVLGRQTNGIGVMNVSGGSYSFTGTGNLFIVGENGRGTINLSGTGTMNALGGLRLGHAAGGNGLANLNGGTLNARSISYNAAAPSGAIYLNGGTIKPSITNATFFTGVPRAVVGPNAAKFDTNGFDITVGQALTPATGNGLSSVAIATGGAGYLGQPIVQITGGGGSDAAAIATVSGGVVTGIVITNPGSGYTGTPTVTLLGGGSTTAATLGAVTTAAVAADGGLQKSGAGVLTLSGSNTYLGGTTITAGTLALQADNLSDTGAVTVNGGILSMLGGDTVGAVTLTSGSVTGTGLLTASSFLVNNTTGTVNVDAPLGGTGTNLTKTGAGILLLNSADNSYTGTTSVTGGGTLAFGPLGILNTASSLSVNAGTVDVRNGTSTGLQQVTNLTLNAGTLVFGATGGSTDVLKATGTTSATGVTTIKIVGALDSGTYNVLQTATPLSNANFVLDTTGVLGGFTTYTGSVVGNNYRITAAGVATPGEAWWKNDRPTASWADASGAPSNSNWATTAAGTVDTQQIPGATTNVHFSATAPGTTATTLGANFSIGSLTFETGSASVTGGVNTLNILGLNANNYPLEVKTGASAGINATVNYTGQTMINTGGTLTFTGGTLGSATGELLLDGTLNVNGDLTKGSITGAGTINKTLAGTSTFTIGNENSQVFGGTIANTTGTLNFTKAGTGDLLLNGTSNTFSGVLKVAGGKLEISNTGALGNPSAIVQQSGSTFVNSVGNLSLSIPYSFDLNGGAAIGVAQTVIGNGDGNYNLVLASGTTTLSGLISSNGGSLAKRGPGTLVITNPGANVLAAGAGIAFAIQEGDVVLNGGATASYGVTSPTGELTIGDITPNQVNLTLTSGALTVGQFISVGRGNGSTGLQSTLNLNGGTLSVPNLYSGFAGGAAGYNAQPTINLSGTTANVTNVRIGESAGAYGILNLNSGALTATGQMEIGWSGKGKATSNMPISVGNLKIGGAAGGAGAFYNNSTITSTLGASTDNFAIGNGANAYGYFRNNTGGSATFAEIGVGGAGGGGAATSGGVLDINGGSITATAWITPNRSNGTLGQTCLINVTGGTLTSPNNGQFRVNTVANADQHAVINVSGTGSIVGAGAASTMNLNNPTGNNYGMLTLGTGGTVQLTSILSTGDAEHAFVNFNGGTLKSGALAPALLASTVVGHVQAGGATVDTNGFDSTIQAPLRAPANSGVQSIPLTTQGAGYIGRPLVRITGDGTGATAVADFNPATGEVTGITITSPGSGYNTAPTVTLIGGGGTTAAVAGAPVMVNGATNGGLTKVGTGTLTLSGINTYSGNTTVSAGGLTLADDAQLRFRPTTNGVTNSVGGTGTATFNGDFLIDTSVANITNGNSWTLVNVGTLTETFGASFTVSGFTEVANVWTLTVGDNTWTFSEATGVLSLTVSSPGGYGAWATGYSLGAGSELGDPDADGIKNLMEYVFGGVPTGAGASNTSILPTQTLNTTNLIVTFRRSDISETDTAVKVQWSNNLTTWTDFATIGAGDALPAVDVTEDSPDASLDTIVVTIPRAGREAGGKLFARVQAVK